jgi:hypothetical protein
MGQTDCEQALQHHNTCQVCYNHFHFQLLFVAVYVSIIQPNRLNVKFWAYDFALIARKVSKVLIVLSSVGSWFRSQTCYQLTYRRALPWADLSVVSRICIRK